MRVITEEILTKVRNELSEKGNVLGACAIDKLITDYLEEIDQLTVSKLRPMSEAPKSIELDENSVTILAIHSEEKQFIPVIVFNDGDVTSSYEGFAINEFDGWIPMPIYKPDQHEHS